MSGSKPFSLRIFVVDGDPDGLRLVERSNWIGKAMIFPRALLPRIKQRAELGQTGVYLLLGPREEGEGETLYVGEGDPVLPRLQDHFARKDFWNRVVCFVAAQGQLNKAHVQFLEARLIEGADKMLDYLEVVHVLVRRPRSSGSALFEVGKAHQGDHQAVGLPDKEFPEGLAS